jgi:hypothetical protein
VTQSNDWFDNPAYQEPQLYGGKRWGVWKFNARNLTLEWVGGYGYYIDLEEIDSSCEMLDWLFHIAEKTDVDESIVGDLVLAFEEIFHARARFCQSKEPFDPAAFKRWLRKRIVPKRTLRKAVTA